MAWFSGSLRTVASDNGARFVMYAGAPQREPLIHYGEPLEVTN